MLKEAFFLARWHHVRWARQALEGLSGKLLDLGTGGGKIVREVLRRRKGWKLVGVDIKREKGWQVDVVADGRDLPMKDREFNGVLILDVLEHVKNPEKMVKEAVRVLKKGGVLHVTVPLEGVWWTIDWWLRKLFKADWTRETIGHINKFELKEVEEMLRTQGLVVEWKRFSHHCLYQLGTAVYFWYLSRKPKKELKAKGKYWLPVPGWVRLGIGLFGWLTVVESLVLSRIPGREVHVTARKVERR